MFSYSVSCTFDDPQVSAEWIKWLRDEHLRDVCHAGAKRAEVVQFDRPGDSAPVRCEVRYAFASRAAFQQYERDHAPRLRAEGLRRFPLDRGLAYARTGGEIVALHEQ